ncbi:hypothetical protein M885DRAFT_613131 [Pelagophyceae sp. CCMP2097]|nr:hypothetical protein M885DRAFT_613131 [Pelagophyceae sp. CCMP2097]
MEDDPQVAPPKGKGKRKTHWWDSREQLRLNRQRVAPPEGGADGTPTEAPGVASLLAAVSRRKSGEDAFAEVRRLIGAFAVNEGAALGLSRLARALALAGCGDSLIFEALADKIVTDAKRRPRTEADVAALPEVRALLGLAGVDAKHSCWKALGGYLAPWSTEALDALWTYSAAQKKVSKSEDSACPWPPAFADDTLPLVVDVGSGFGASCVSFALHSGKYNVLGCDRATHALHYGAGLAKRRGLEGRCQFVAKDGTEVLEYVREVYLKRGGSVAFLLVQFPTPFALDGGKNAQLPTANGKFMANDRLFRGLEAVASKGTLIFFQSNTEDVAVTMRQRFEALVKKDTFAAVTESEVPEDGEEEELALRTLKWIDAGGARAKGPGWLQSSPLPNEVRTETEAHYEQLRKPIHRCAFKRL